MGSTPAASRMEGKEADTVMGRNPDKCGLRDEHRRPVPIAKPLVGWPNALAIANGARMHARIPNGGSRFVCCGATSAPLKSLDVDLTLLNVVPPARPVTAIAMWGL